MAKKDKIIVTKELTKEQINFIYASEADVLNVALFGMPNEQRDVSVGSNGYKELIQLFKKSYLCCVV